MAAYIFVILLFTCIFPFKCCSNVNFSIPIIHRNSPISPLYNPNMTIFDLIELDKARLESSIHYKTYNPTSSNNVGFKAQSSYLSGAYLMEIHIGSSHEKRHVFFDTSSDLTWIQCQPCFDCNFKNIPPFHELSSTTYQPVSCKEKICHDDKRLACTNTYGCNFQVSYFDGGNVEGIMAHDSLHVPTTTNKEDYQEIKNFTFGCAHMERTKHAEFDGDGLIGLGLGPLSLLSQMSIKKFSYCIPPAPDEDTEGYHQIAFGNMAITPGQRTPLVSDPESFVIRLEGISFQSIRLPMQFPNLEANFKIKLDSSTTGIWLHQNAYFPLSMAITNAIKLERYPSENQQLEHCYFGTLKDVQDLKITLHFHSNVQVELSKWSVFHKIRNTVCLIILPTQGDYSVLGMYGQINQNIGYDLVKQEISFYPIDCTII